MDWKQKMCEMVCDILNEDCAANYYTMYFDDTFNDGIVYKFYIEKQGKRIHEVETIEKLSAHWKQFAKEVVRKVIEDKIRHYLVFHKEEPA